MATSSTKTKGQEKSANRQVWAIAGPAIVANSSAPLVGLIDTWAIGHLPVATHLAAVGIGATVFSFIFWAFGFLRMSTTGLIAQANGKEDWSLMRRTMLRSLVLGLAIAFMLLGLQQFLLNTSLMVLAPTEGVSALFSGYFAIRIWSAPAVLLTYAVSGFLIGVAKARSALVVQLVLNIGNGALNLLFVLVFGMGAEGIALGSLIAEWLAAVTGVIMVAKYLGFSALLQTASEKTLWKLSGFARLAQTNGYIFVRTLLLLSVLTILMRQASVLGEDHVAASHVANVFMLLISLGLDGFAYAAEALAGAAFGKGVRADFRNWVWITTKWALCASVAYTALFYWFGNEIVGSLTDVAGVRTQALLLMPVIVWLPVVSVWCYQFDGIFIGATAAGAMMVTMAISFLAFILLIDPMTEAMGLLGIWLAFLVFQACRGLTQALYYPRVLSKIPSDR